MRLPLIQDDHLVKQVATATSHPTLSHRRNGLAMVAEKRQPSLHRMWIFPSSADPSRDTPFRDIETELEQFTMNARCSPSRILGNHTEDQGAKLFDTLPSAHLFESRDPGPIQTKPLPMPVHDGSRSDQDEGLPPPGPASSDRFSRTRSSRDLKALTIHPRRCRSNTIMARILSQKPGRAFRQVIHFLGVRRFGETQA